MDRSPVLLVNPYIEDFAAYDHFSKPLGLLRLASYLNEHFDVRFINCLSRTHPLVGKLKFNMDGTGDFYKTFIPKPPSLSDIPRRFKRYGIPEEAFLKELQNLPQKPRYIFVTSMMTYWFTGLQVTLNILRKVFLGVPIILGGVYPSLLPEHAKATIDADYIVAHQELGKVLDSLENILGVQFCRDEKPPLYDILGEFYSVPLLTSVGCVFQCNYCASSFLSKFKQLDMDIVFKSIETLVKKHGAQNFAFYDDALLYDSDTHLDMLLEKIIYSDIRVKFHTPNGLHIRFLTSRTTQLMKQAGFTDIRLSLESSEPEFQTQEGAKAVNDEFERAMEILQKAGFTKSQIKVYTLLNVPGQNPNSVEKTMRYINDTGGLPQLAFYSPIPNTPDFQKAMQITDLSDPLSHNNSVYLYRSGFNIDYLHQLKRLEQECRKVAIAE